MKERIRTSLLVVAMFLAAMCMMAAPLSAQVYSTARTGGKGVTSASAQAYGMKYLGAWSTGGWVQVSRGVSSYADVFALAGFTNYEGATQPWVGVGSNVTLANVGGFDFSLYDFITVPTARKDESSTAFLDAALLTSRSVGKVTPYAGINFLVPIGNTHQATFTPPRTERQWVLGLAFPVGTWSAMVEYDAGDLRSFGVSAGRSF